MPYNSDKQVISTLFANADSYYIRDLGQDMLYDVLTQTLADNGSIDKRIQFSVFNYIKRLPEKDYWKILNKLTTEESNFITFVYMGLSRDEISDRLGVSSAQLSNFIYSIFEKLVYVVKFGQFDKELVYDLFKNLKFNLKTKIVLVNVAFITMVLTCFALNLSPQTFISHRVIMVFETILLICANIFNYILLLNRLKISNDEFLKYRLCRNCKHCEIGIDSLLNQIFMTTPDVIAFMDTNQRYVMCSKNSMIYLKYLRLKLLEKLKM